MLGSGGARNISFQDLFAHPRELRGDTDSATTTATSSTTNSSTSTSTSATTSTEPAIHGRHSHAGRTAAVAALGSPLRDPSPSLPARTSIGFLLDHPHDEHIKQMQTQTQQQFLLQDAFPGQQQQQEQQLVEIKQEPEQFRRDYGSYGDYHDNYGDYGGYHSVRQRKKKRKARICKEAGCDKYVVDHGLCIRHGGGKRCNVEDCNCRAQNRGLCWKHGGYTICKVEGCTKRAKSRGICWSHGGGTRCKTEGCSKIAVSLGRCWAHGGGKRCVIEGCKKPASERTNNYCTDHFGWFRQEAEASTQAASEHASKKQESEGDRVD